MAKRSFFQRRWNLNKRTYGLKGERVKGRLQGKGTANIVGPGTYGDSTVQGQPSTYGLNAANQELAELGTSVPVLFGNRAKDNGGFVTTPYLIYQRMYSAGAYEETRIGFILGEGGNQLDKPNQRGIRIGTDLLHSKQSEFYEIRFTDGATNDNDPTKGNTDPWGNKFTPGSSLGNGQRFFAIRDPGQEVRGLSQSFDPGVSFGLESEQPDCEQSYDQEFTTLIPTPNPNKPPLIKYSRIDGSVGNTRACRTTEFGFAVNMPQPAPVSQEGSGEGPVVGSKWKYKRLSISTNALRLCWDNGALDPDTMLPLISGVFDSHPDGFKIEVISADTAFYALYRPFYETESQEDIAVIYNRFLSSYGSYVFYIDRQDLPSPIWAMVQDEFNPVQGAGNSYFERVDGQFADENFNAVDPCEVFLDNEDLLDPRVPKVFFKLYYRKIEENNIDWKPVTNKQFCLLSPNAATLYANLKVHHPNLDEQAYEFKFKPLTPLLLEEDSQAIYEKCRYGVATNTGTTTVEPACILYPSRRQEQQIQGEDGFVLTFDGLLEPVRSEIKLDVQSENFDIKISYVNEFIEDPDVKYPFMSVGTLSVRAGKSFSSLDQLSFYYDDGAQITRVDNTIGASSLFPDLCYYILTQYPGGGPGPVDVSQVDVLSFDRSNLFTGSKNLRYNGVIADRVGIHEFINEHAKYFLLRFGTNNGRYTLYSALDDSVTNTPIAEPTQVVTLDILDPDSFTIDYATLSEREDAKMQVIWRRQDQNMPGVNESVTVQPLGYNGPNKVTHDISGFCTSKEHAITVARFLSALRQEQDRVVSFTCADSPVDLAPGRLFTFDILIETSVGNTYTNTDQYQVTSRTYRDDGTLDVRAVHMPAGIHDKVFTDQEFEEVF